MTSDLVRYLGFTIFAVCSAAALASWAVRTRQVAPFGRTARLLRTMSDPLINPVERRLLTSGGNPVNAPWWLFGIGLVAGILIVSVYNWVAAILARLSYAASSGPGSVFWFLVHALGELVLLALIVRVIASWLGIGRYNKWMRPAYILTDWMVEPLRKIIPPIGMIDITPLVAWLALQLILGSLPR